MKLFYDGQLLTIHLLVSYRDKLLEVRDVIVDTGSSHTVIKNSLTTIEKLKDILKVKK